MSRRDTPWIVFGAQEHPDKCVIAVKNGLGGMRELVLGYLKHPIDDPESHKSYEINDVSGIAYHICFAKRESLQAFIKAAQGLLENWNEVS